MGCVDRVTVLTVRTDFGRAWNDMPESSVTLSGSYVVERRSARSSTSQPSEPTMSALLKNNVGPLDRFVRFVVGLGVLSLVFVGPQTPWGYVGIIPLLTSLVGSCPLYSLLGFSTCPMKRA